MIGIIKEKAMTKEDIQSTVSRIIKERFLVNCDNKYDDSLIDAGLDSMNMIQLIVELEKILSLKMKCYLMKCCIMWKRFLNTYTRDY